MSLSLSRASLPGIAGLVEFGPALVALAACLHASPVLDEPSPAERLTVGDRQQQNQEQLRRRFPGVVVIETRRGGFSIRILGGVVGDGEPLYIIDGTPMPVESGRGIDWLKLEDVAKIEALKNPAETTVYGPRGINGVILITTKQALLQRKRGPDTVLPHALRRTSFGGCENAATITARRYQRRKGIGDQRDRLMRCSGYEKARRPAPTSARWSAERAGWDTGSVVARSHAESGLRHPSTVGKEKEAGVVSIGMTGPT